MAEILTIKNLTKLFANDRGINNFSCQINSGDIYGFIGSNGAGKTTTLKCIVGINNFTSGEIKINNFSIKDNLIDAKRQFGYIPDNPELMENISGLKYLNFICDVFGVPYNVRKNKIEYYAKKLDLLDDLSNLISSYSRGMKQKLVIIGVLIHEPKILIMDEPFSALDPITTFNFKKILLEYVKNGNAVLFSSHVLEIVENLCNKVHVIKDGKTIIVSSTASLLKNKKSLEDKYIELISNEKK